jgi:hypothetical protein
MESPTFAINFADLINKLVILLGSSPWEYTAQLNDLHDFENIGSIRHEKTAHKSIIKNRADNFQLQIIQIVEVPVRPVGQTIWFPSDRDNMVA